MLLSNTKLGMKPSEFEHDEIDIHYTTTQHYGRHTALRGRLAALGFTLLFTRVERLSAGLTLTGVRQLQEWVQREWGQQEWVQEEAWVRSRRQANSHRPTQPELALIRVLWVGLSRYFLCWFLCSSSRQWCPGRQQVISTEGPLLRMV